MAKKYYKLEFLESFIGKEYLCTNGQIHLRVVGVSNNKFATRTFDTQLQTYTVKTTIPLKNEFTGLINVDRLLDTNTWIEKTTAVKVLFDTNKKRGPAQVTEECDKDQPNNPPSNGGLLITF